MKLAENEPKALLFPEGERACLVVKLLDTTGVSPHSSVMKGLLCAPN